MSRTTSPPIFTLRLTWIRFRLQPNTCTSKSQICPKLKTGHPVELNFLLSLALHSSMDILILTGCFDTFWIKGQSQWFYRMKYWKNCWHSCFWNLGHVNFPHVNLSHNCVISCYEKLFVVLWQEPSLKSAVQYVTRPFCLVESCPLDAAAMWVRSMFTSFTFCNIIFGCSLI